MPTNGLKVLGWRQGAGRIVNRDRRGCRGKRLKKDVEEMLPEFKIPSVFPMRIESVMHRQ